MTVDVPKIIKEKTGKEFLEVINETDRPILATACKSKLTNQLYVHIGKAHDTETEVPSHGSSLVEITEVDI